MLGVIQSDKRGETDRLIASAATTLHAKGLRVAGFIQINTEIDENLPCVMDLMSVDGAVKIRISQDLGREGQGCRLDPRGLEEAVGLVETMIARYGADLLIVNKFGKQEGEGRGFRMLIGASLVAGIPVLTAVSARNLAAFADFAQGIETQLPADSSRVLEWCEQMIGLSAAK
jgi:Protein of unknown function (DUF2478)